MLGRILGGLCTERLRGSSRVTRYVNRVCASAPAGCNLDKVKGAFYQQLHML